MTRLSCHRFRANEVRLWLSLIAHNLGNQWRRLELPTQVATWPLTSLQQRLVKTGGRLIKHARYYWLLAGGEPPHTAAVRRPAQDHGLVGAGGINGTLIADKLGRRKAAQGAVRRESPAESRGAVLESGRNGSQRATAATASGLNSQTAAELTLESLSG